MERQPRPPPPKKKIKTKQKTQAIKTLGIILGSYTSLQTLIIFDIVQHYCASICDVIKHLSWLEYTFVLHTIG